MMNHGDIEQMETSIRKYVHKCFRDACASEGRDLVDYHFDYVCVQNSLGKWQLLPINFNYRYAKVLRRVRYRIEKNLEKNFGLIYGDSDELHYLLYSSGDTKGHKYAQIDPNWTAAMIKLKDVDKFVSLSLIDVGYYDMPEGECIPAYKYEKLIFNYWHIDASIYNGISDKNDPRLHLPDKFSHDWEAFWKLHVNTFDEAPGSKYDMVCSSSVELVRFDQ